MHAFIKKTTAAPVYLAISTMLVFHTNDQDKVGILTFFLTSWHYSRHLTKGSIGEKYHQLVNLKQYPSINYYFQAVENRLINPKVANPKSMFAPRNQ